MTAAALLQEFGIELSAGGLVDVIDFAEAESTNIESKKSRKSLLNFLTTFSH